MKNNKNYFSLTIFFKIILFINIANFVITSRCPQKEKPLLKNEQCVSSCEFDEINTGTCIIENDIIKTQILNNIFKIGLADCAYVNLATSEKNDLYFLTASYSQNNIRKFYLLNNEGYSLINEDPYLSFEVSNNAGKFESEIFTMKLYESNDDKEYLVSLSKAAQNIEIYDFNQNEYQYYMDTIVNVFNIPYNNYQNIGVHLKLKVPAKEKKNEYLISFIACKGETCDEESSHIYLMKTKFTSLNIISIKPEFTYTKFENYFSKVVSCYETEKNYLICFYINSILEYTMIVFNYQLGKQTEIKIDDAASGTTDWFFKCVHFFNEIGVFGYFKDSVFQFQFKEYINSTKTIEGRFINPQIKLDNYNFNKESINMCDMIKVNDKKFYFVGVLNEYKDVLIIMSIVNYDEEKLSKRIYKIPSKNYYNYIFAGKIRLTLYNNLLVLGAAYFILPSWETSSSLLIFSYPITDSNSIDLISYMYIHNDTKIYDLLVELEGKYSRIDNNIFGLVHSGIKIISNCQDLETIYLADLDNNKIISDYYLSKNESIRLIIPKEENYNSFTCQFNYAIVVSEPEFEKFNLYTEEYLDTGNDDIHKEEEFFQNQKTNYTGKSNVYKLILEYDLTEINCGENCELCKSHNEDPVPDCVSCKYSSHFDGNNKKICEENTQTTEAKEDTDINNVTETDIYSQINISSEDDSSTEITPFSQADINTENYKPIETIIQTEIISFIDIDSSTETYISTGINIPIETITSQNTNIQTDTDTSEQTDRPIKTDISIETNNPIESHIPNQEDYQTESDIKTSISIDISTQKDISIQSSELNNDENSYIVKVCNFDEIVDNKCSNEINNTQIKEVYSYIQSNLIRNNYTLIQTDNVIFEVSKIKTQMNSNVKNISNIDLGKCEERLKSTNNISESKDLIIFKIDIKNLNQSTTYVQYEIYNPDNYIKLEMSICADLKINIYSPIYLNDEAQSLFSSLKESGYNLFNSNDSFYNDFCTPYTSIEGTDILLKDRKKDIYQKNGDKDLCQKNCELEYYNEITQKAKCNCIPQANSTNIDLYHEHLNNKHELEKSFFNTLSNANFQVLKCFKLAFNLKTIYENIGRIIMTIIALFAFSALVFYFFCENKKLKNYLSQILNQKLYEKKSNKDLNNHSKHLDKKEVIIQQRKLDKKSLAIHPKRADKKSLTIRPKRKDKKSLSFHQKRTDKKSLTIHRKKLDKRDLTIHPKKEEEINSKLIDQKTNINVIRKKKPSNTQRKIGKIINIDNFDIDDKGINIKINRKSKKFQSQKINKIISNILNMNDITDRRNNLKSPSFKKNNFNSPPRKNKIAKISEKKITSEESKICSKQKILDSNNSYKKVNNRRKNELKTAKINSKELFIESKDKNNIESLYSIDKSDKINKKEENFTNEELNKMEYKKALIYDKRTFFQYYWSLIKKKQIIFFVLLNKDDYNLISVKVILFIISFSLYFTLNGFFFNDSTMHRIYKNKGAYELISQIPIIFYSSMITAIINLALKSLSLSEKDLLEIKQESNLKKAKQKSKGSFPCLKLKITIFFILSFLLILFFWYFITCFCAVYKNTQIILINDTLVSFSLSMIYPFGIYLIPGMFRIPSLRSKSKNKECIYKASVIISLI